MEGRKAWEAWASQTFELLRFTGPDDARLTENEAKSYVNIVWDAWCGKAPPITGVRVVAARMRGTGRKISTNRIYAASKALHEAGLVTYNPPGGGARPLGPALSGSPLPPPPPVEKEKKVSSRTDFPGVDVRRVKRSDDRCETTQVMLCSVCGAGLPMWNSKGSGAMPPDTMRKRAEHRGWSVDFKKGRHVCDACIVKEEKKKMAEANAPREMTRDDRRRVFRAIDEEYDDKNGRYVGNTTDQILADKLHVPRAWVAEVREEAFGPEGGNEEMHRVASTLGTLVSKAESIEKKAMEVAAEAESYREEIKAMRKRLDALTASVGPRAPLRSVN